MEMFNPKSLNVTVKYGVISGILFVAFTTLTYTLNFSMFNAFYGIVSFIFTFGLIITMMVLAMNEIKRKILNGNISYLQCLISGFITGVIAFYISGVFNYILFGMIDKEYMPQQIEKFAEMLQQYNMDADKLQLQIEKMRNNLDPIKQFVTSLYSSPLIALVISAIVSIFIKKKDDSIISEEEIQNISKD
jgi:hypothetical protein